jgi:hypothetical protein
VASGGASKSGCTGSRGKSLLRPTCTEGFNARMCMESPAAASKPLLRLAWPAGLQRGFKSNCHREPSSPMRGHLNFSVIMVNWRSTSWHAWISVLTWIYPDVAVKNTNLPFQLISQPVPGPQIFGSGLWFRFFIIGSSYGLTIGSVLMDSCHFFSKHSKNPPLVYLQYLPCIWNCILSLLSNYHTSILFF